MASSDSDRDRNTSTSQDKTENPFIRFRRFADAQIGTILQGIVGLPSVFSKSPHTANGRWTDLHDDLKRREIRQAEQETDGMNGRGAGAGSADDEVEIPVKKFRGWSPPSSASVDRPRIPSGMEDESDRDTVELFAPVTKALFAHLNRGRKDEIDWSPPRPETRPKIFDPRLCRHLDMPRLREDQKYGNIMNMIQSMVYDDLNMTAKRTSCRHFHSQRSVLPYLLFSPYSPLALSDMPPPRRAEGLSSPYLEEFPYCAAFEDLLLSSQGRPMGQYILAPAQSFPAIKKANHAMFDGVSKEIRKANAGANWLNAMHIYGLLASEEASTPRHPFSPALPLPFHTKAIPDKEFYERFGRKKTDLQKDAQTELDMYEELERHVPPEAKDLLKEIHNAQQLVRSTIDSMLFGEAPTKSSGDAETKGQKSIATQTDSPSDRAPELGFEHIIGRVLDMLEKSSEADWPPTRKSETVRPGAVPASAPENEPVKTTTTTSQTTHADGAVETVVTVRKVFADGSVSVKETRSSKATPVYSGDNSGMRADDDDYYDNGAEWPSEDGSESKQGGEKNQKKSKGWFWN